MTVLLLDVFVVVEITYLQIARTLGTKFMKRKKKLG